ncbi:MAG: hypothetical protein ACOCQX_01280 [Candidatus Nanoarchaeia archaeon]
MYEKVIDESMDCKIYSACPDFQKNTNIIYVPGFGSVGKSKAQIVQKITDTNPDANVVTFLYKSHQDDSLKNLENDLSDLGQVVNRLQDFDIAKEDVGFLSLCYGAYLTALHLSQNEGHKYAIMIEPFLGKKSLKPLANTVYRTGELLSSMGLKKLPFSKRHYDKLASVDCDSLFKATAIDVPTVYGTPLLAMSVDYHAFLNTEYIRGWTEASGGIFKHLNGKEKECKIHQIINEVKCFQKVHKNEYAKITYN